MAATRPAAGRSPKTKKTATVSTPDNLKDAMIELCKSLLAEFKKATLADQVPGDAVKIVASSPAEKAGNQLPYNRTDVSGGQRPVASHPYDDGLPLASSIQALVSNDEKELVSSGQKLALGDANEHVPKAASLTATMRQKKRGPRKQTATPQPPTFSVERQIPAADSAVLETKKDRSASSPISPQKQGMENEPFSSNSENKDAINIQNENKACLLPEDDRLCQKELKRARLGAGLKLPPPPPFPGAPSQKQSANPTQSERLRQAIAALSSDPAPLERVDKSNIDNASKQNGLENAAEKEPADERAHGSGGKKQEADAVEKENFPCSPILGAAFQQTDDSIQILESPSIHPKPMVVSPTGIPLWQRRDAHFSPSRLSPAASRTAKINPIPPSRLQARPVVSVPKASSLTRPYVVGVPKPPFVSTDRRDSPKKLLPSELFSATRAKLEQLASPLRRETTPRTASQTISKIKNKVAALLSTSTLLSKTTSTHSSEAKVISRGSPLVRTTRTPVQKTPLSLRAISSSCVKQGAAASLRSPVLTPITRTRGTKASECRPTWVITPNLRQSLASQSTVNPEKIFGGLQNLSLEQMFPASLRRVQKPRGSSAVWEGTDMLTEAEKKAYDSAMGYDIL